MKCKMYEYICIMIHARVYHIGALEHGCGSCTVLLTGIIVSDQWVVKLYSRETERFWNAFITTGDQQTWHNHKFPGNLPIYHEYCSLHCMHLDLLNQLSTSIMQIAVSVLTTGSYYVAVYRSNIESGS